jgi:hypothetical protein
MMNEINKMLCQDKFGILLTFNDGDQQIEGIYDTYEEACKKLDFCMKVIKADFTEQCNVDWYISPRSGRYYYDGNYSKNTPRFPIELKVIDVCNDGWTRLHAEIHGIVEED